MNVNWKFRICHVFSSVLLGMSVGHGFLSHKTGQTEWSVQVSEVGRVVNETMHSYSILSLEVYIDGLV